MLYYQIKNYEDFKNGSDLQQRKTGIQKEQNIARTLKNPCCSGIVWTTITACCTYPIWQTYRKKILQAVKESGRNDRKKAYKQGGTDRGNLSSGLAWDKWIKGYEDGQVFQSVISMNRHWPNRKIRQGRLSQTGDWKAAFPGIELAFRRCLHRQWYTYAYRQYLGLKSVCDNRFDKIYDYWKCKGDLPISQTNMIIS